MKSRNAFGIGALLLGLTALAAPHTAAAANNFTPACTPISNTASVAYKVGTITQTPKTSTKVITVGNRIGVKVSRGDTSIVSVTPGQTNVVLTFGVTNDGNGTEDFGLAKSNKATGTADPFGGAVNDNFDIETTGTVNVYADVNNNGVYDAGVDTATYIDELASDGSKTVFVVGSAIDLAQLNTDVAVYALTATAEKGGTVGSEGAAETEGALNACAGTAPTVFADLVAGSDDAAKDGKDSIRDAFKVSAASLTVSKTSAVYSDPATGTGTALNPKAIPGAVVTYTITVSNGSGAATAANVSISDALKTEINNNHVTFNTAFDNSADAGGINCGAAKGILLDGVCKTNAAGDDEAEWDQQANPNDKQIIVSGLSIPANGSAVIKFQVTIK